MDAGPFIDDGACKLFQELRNFTIIFQVRNTLIVRFSRPWRTPPF